MIKLLFAISLYTSVSLKSFGLLIAANLKSLDVIVSLCHVFSVLVFAVPIRQKKFRNGSATCSFFKSILFCNSFYWMIFFVLFHLFFWIRKENKAKSIYYCVYDEKVWTRLQQTSLRRFQEKCFPFIIKPFIFPSHLILYPPTFFSVSVNPFWYFSIFLNPKIRIVQQRNQNRFFCMFQHHFKLKLAFKEKENDLEI